MRVMVVPSASRERGALEQILEQRGHHVVVAHARWPKPSKRRELALAANVARHALTSTIDVAFVEGTHRTSAVTAALTAARVPYVLGIETAPLDMVGPPTNSTTRALAKPRLPITVEVCRQAVRFSMRGAKQTVAYSRDIAEHLYTQTGVDGAHVVPDGMPMHRLPLGARADARAALGLLDGARYIALVGELSAGLPYEQLLFAHRTVAGVGLLVAGDGPGAQNISAMSVATRPSSPVIHVGPQTEATMVALTAACDVALSLGLVHAAPEAAQYSALGRRQVLLDVPETRDLAALYPAHDTVFVAAPNAESIANAMRAALDAERTEGPLPYWAVAAARDTLAKSRTVALAEHLESCG